MRERLRRFAGTWRSAAGRPEPEPGTAAPDGPVDRPRQPFNREDALRFPLNAASHDVGLRYLFDFTIATSALDLQPGAQVLDFAAGSSYVSELLNRLGYSTVAYDYDPGILAVGRERLGIDPRCAPERTKFACGDGTVLPFADESFDGTICLNSFHHMPSYRDTLKELHRVLKPGGRAAFSEPGNQHASSPESISVMKQYGVVERDVCIDEIAELAREIGFRRLVLRPLPYPEFTDLPYEEFSSLRAGGAVSSPVLTPRGLADYFETQHTLFFLEKAGARRLTSATAKPNLLKAEISVQGCPSTVPVGGEISVTATCRNVGQSAWISRTLPLGGFVTLGVKVLNGDGLVVDDARGRAALAHDVEPGGAVEVETRFSVDGLSPGDYSLLFDMVDERVCWFEMMGSATVSFPVRIG